MFVLLDSSKLFFDPGKKNIPCCEQDDNEKKKNGMLDDWALQMVGTQ